MASELPAFLYLYKLSIQLYSLTCYIENSILYSLPFSISSVSLSSESPQETITFWSISDFTVALSVPLFHVPFQIRQSRLSTQSQSANTSLIESACRKTRKKFHLSFIREYKTFVYHTQITDAVIRTVSAAFIGMMVCHKRIVIYSRVHKTYHALVALSLSLRRAAISVRCISAWLALFSLFLLFTASIAAVLSSSSYLVSARGQAQ